jgi:hypothetical protein
VGWNPFKRAAAAKLKNQEAEVLAQLKGAGADLSKPADVNHYLYFARQADAQKAGEALTQKGFKVEVKPGAAGPQWLCLANERMVPSSANVEKRTELLEGLAASLSGEYDGWEASVER